MARRLTYEEVKHFIEVESNSGCKLLSKEYINNNAKMLFRCKCGNKFKTTYNIFQQGKRQCSECSLKSRIDKRRRKFSNEEIKDIIKMYNEKHTMEVIANKYKTKSDKVSKILKENNIRIKNVTEYYSVDELATNRKYNFTRDYFHTIDSEYKAYWLGFLFADGNVHIREGMTGGSKGGTVEVGLKAEDDYHIYNFIKCIDGDMPIEYRDVMLNDKIYPSARVQINSIEMANDLIDKGCVPCKSLILEPPKDVPSKLVNHFIRGYLDGDGCIGFYVYEKFDNFNASILGTEKFLMYIKNHLENNGINCSKITATNSNINILYIYGQDNLANLYNYLYKDASIFLGRKIDRFRQALLYFNKDFNISEVARLSFIFDDDLQEKIYKKNMRKSI